MSRQLPIPFSNDTTSREAGESIRPHREIMRAGVLAYIRTCGELGATDEEIAHRLFINPSTVRPRRGELVKLGLVRETDGRRKTLSGRKAIVWVSA